MRKSLTFLSAALVSATLLTGCGANNAAEDTNNGMRNVSYNTSPTNPNVTNDMNQVRPNASTPNNVTNIDDYNNGAANPPFANNNVTLNNQTAQKVANEVNKINGVKYATTLVSGNAVYVGVTTTAGHPVPTQQITNVVQKYVGNKAVHVVSDKSTVDRMVNLNDRVMNGNAPAREINSDVRGILNDMGDAVKRPFQNNAR